MDDNDVQITKNKTLLERIRSQRDGSGRDQSSRVGVGDATNRTGDNSQGPRVDPAIKRRDPGVEERTGASSNTSQRDGQRIRPPDGQSINTTKGATYDNKETGRGSTGQRIDEKQKFQFRSPFPKKEQGPVKLFSKTEAELEYDKMFDIYFRGWALVDDLLEIAVKGHEPVEIWQLSVEEADMLATMHLQRAQYDEKSARSARKLLEIYDRIYMYMLIWPRVKLTGNHITSHGGLSFK